MNARLWHPGWQGTADAVREGPARTAVPPRPRLLLPGHGGGPGGHAARPCQAARDRTAAVRAPLSRLPSGGRAAGHGRCFFVRWHARWDHAERLARKTRALLGWRSRPAPREHYRRAAHRRLT